MAVSSITRKPRRHAVPNPRQEEGWHKKFAAKGFSGSQRMGKNKGGSSYAWWKIIILFNDYVLSNTYHGLEYAFV